MVIFSILYLSQGILYDPDRLFFTQLAELGFIVSILALLEFLVLNNKEKLLSYLRKDKVV